MPKTLKRPTVKLWPLSTFPQLPQLLVSDVISPSGQPYWVSYQQDGQNPLIILLWVPRIILLNKKCRKGVESDTKKGRQLVKSVLASKLSLRKARVQFPGKFQETV